MKDENAKNFSFGDLYETLEISADIRKELEAAASELIGISKRSTAQAFDLGEHLERAAALLPEGQFNKWLDRRCGFTPRNARLYRAVHRNLTPYKKTLVDLGVGATALGKLSSADKEQIEAAIAFAKENGRLRGGDVDAILRADQESDEGEMHDPYFVGGVDGLKTIVSMKHREMTRMFIKTCQEIIEAVNTALEGKRILKKELMTQIGSQARIASQYLENLTLMLAEGKGEHRYLAVTPLSPLSPWANTMGLLGALGRHDGWPVSTDLRKWLENTVVPTLNWAVSQEKNPAWKATARPLSEDELAPAQEMVVKSRHQAIQVDLNKLSSADGRAGNTQKPKLREAEGEVISNAAALADASTTVSSGPGAMRR